MKKFYLLTFIFSLLLTSCSNDTLLTEEDNFENYTVSTQETAFANCMSPDHISCFLDDGFGRWGWTNGPVTNGRTSPLIAGAGQCDLDKGTVVGSVAVKYNNETGMVKVEYTIYDGWKILETHLYVGGTPYPLGNNGKPTVAPGKYPYSGQLVYEVPAPKPFYYIAHAVVAPDDAE